MDQRRIEFFWDPASPYTYLASTQIEALAARHDAVIEWRPFVLGKVFEAAGNVAPATIPAKGRQLFVDLQRWARLYRVPLTMPKIFPIHSISALRAGCAANEHGCGAAYARAIMAAYWVEGRDISQMAEIEDIANKAGLDGVALTTLATTQPIKDQLRINTDEAIARGAFGAPTFFCDGQMFWGNDRLAHLGAFLSGEL